MFIVDKDRGEDAVLHGQAAVAAADGRHHLFPVPFHPGPQGAWLEFQAGALQDIQHLRNILNYGSRIQLINREMSQQGIILSVKRPTCSPRKFGAHSWRRNSGELGLGKRYGLPFTVALVKSSGTRVSSPARTVICLLSTWRWPSRTISARRL